MSKANLIFTKQPDEKAAPFDGFPYLVARVVDSLHHILLMPRSRDIQYLISFAQKQVRANRLPTCLVLAQDQCVYFREDGSGFRSSDVTQSFAILLSISILQSKDKLGEMGEEREESEAEIRNGRDGMGRYLS